MNLNHMDIQNGGESNYSEGYDSGNDSIGYPSSYASSYGGLSYASDADDDLSISSRYNEGYQSGGDEGDNGDNSEKSENVQSVQKIPIINDDQMKETYLTLMHILKGLTRTHFNEIYDAYVKKYSIENKGFTNQSTKIKDDDFNFTIESTKKKDDDFNFTLESTKIKILQGMTEYIKSKLKRNYEKQFNQFSEKDTRHNESIAEHFYTLLENLKINEDGSIPLQTLQTLIAKYALFYLLFYIYKTKKTTNEDETYQHLKNLLNNEYTIDLSYNTRVDDDLSHNTIVDAIINYSEKENPDSKLTNSLMKTHNDFMSDKPNDWETNPFFTLDKLYP